MIDLTNRANYALYTLAYPLFSIFLHRQTIAIAINYRLAMRFKRRYPACTVKFIGFEGGVA